MQDEDLISGNEVTSPELETTGQTDQTPSSNQPQLATLPEDENTETTGGAESISSILDAFSQQRAGNAAASPATASRAAEARSQPQPAHDDLDASQQTPRTAKPPVAATAPASTQTPSRNYEGLTEEEAGWFAGMRNASYNALYPRFLKFKELEAKHEELVQQMNEGKNAHFYEQEGAWQLSPEYQQLSSQASGLRNEVSFWESQLEKIESGEKWSRLMVDPQTGRLFPGEEVDPTPKGRAFVLSKLNQANAYAIDVQNRMGSYESGFKEKHSSYVNSLRKIELDVCGGAENLKKLEKMLPDRLKRFPTHVRNRPEIRTLGLAWLLLDAVLQHSNARAGRAASQGISAVTARTAGPARAGAVAGGNGNGGEKVKDILNKFSQAQQGLL